MAEHTQLAKQPIVIAITDDESAALDIKELTPVGLLVPAVLDDTALTFQASYDGVTYFNVYDVDGTELAVAVVVDAARHIILDPAVFFGFRFMKIRQGTNASPVSAVAERTFQILTRNI